MSDAIALDVGDTFGDALGAIWAFVPKFLLFVVILVVGYLLARLLRDLADKLLRRVGFDRAVERGGIGRVLARSSFDATGLVAKLVFYGILLIALQLAFGVFGPNPVSDLIAAVVGWLPNAIIAIVIVVVAAAIAGAVRDIIGGALGGLGYGRLLARTAAAFIIGLGVIAALNQIGIATSVTTPVLIAVLATIAGILIVGVGGGLVRPMQQRWDRWLSTAEQESSNVRQHAQAYSLGRQEARRQREAAEAAAAAQVQAAHAAQAQAAAAQAAQAQAAAQAPPVQAPPSPAEPTVATTYQPTDGGYRPTTAAEAAYGSRPRTPGADDDTDTTAEIRNQEYPRTDEPPYRP